MISLKKKTELVTAIFSLLLLSTGVLTPHAFAVANWQTGGQANTQTNTKELVSNVKMPNLPSAAAEPNTIIWIGGWSSPAHNYLNQPELRAWTTTTWKAFFEVYDQTTNSDAEALYQTNVNLNPTHTANLDVFLTGAGASCQIATNQATGATASHCFSAHNYGTSFNLAQGALESYDFTSSDFHSMSGTIPFTGYRGYVGSTSYSPSFSVYSSGSGGSVPSCISASAGTGTITITVSC
jgi:hypothetical protein